MMYDYSEMNARICISEPLLAALKEMARITRHDNVEVRAQFYGAQLYRDMYYFDRVSGLNDARLGKDGNTQDMMDMHAAVRGETTYPLILDIHTHSARGEFGNEVFYDKDFRKFSSNDIAAQASRCAECHANGYEYLSCVIGCDPERGSATLQFIWSTENGDTEIYKIQCVAIYNNNGDQIGTLPVKDGVIILEDLGQKTELLAS